MPLPRKRLIQKGNAITEYGLIGLLLAGAGLAGLLHYGDALNGQWQAFSNSIERKPSVKAANVIPVAQLTGLPSGGIAPVNLAKSPLVSMEEFSSTAQTKSIIEVAGANGTTEQMLFALESKVKVMTDEGLITENQASELLELANRGHYLASGQKTLEDALKAGQRSVSFNGNTYPTNEFIRMVGYQRGPIINETWTLSPELANPVMKPFTEKYQEILQNGTLTNTVVRQEVSELAITIGALADSLVWGAEDILAGSSTPPQSGSVEVNSIVAGRFSENMEWKPDKTTLSGQNASSATDYNSAEICTKGSGRDSGQNCQEQ